MQAMISPGRSGTLEHLRVQYGDALGTVVDEEDTASTATYFTPGGEVVLALERSPRGLWRYDFSDLSAGSTAVWRKRWGSAAAALADSAYRWRYASTTEVAP